MNSVYSISEKREPGYLENVYLEDRLKVWGIFEDIEFSFAWIAFDFLSALTLCDFVLLLRTVVSGPLTLADHSIQFFSDKHAQLMMNFTTLIKHNDLSN